MQCFKDRNNDQNTRQNNQIFYIHVWQSRVEIEHYSIAITAFEALCAELQLRVGLICSV